jgi:hypothetical protein
MHIAKVQRALVAIPAILLLCLIISGCENGGGSGSAGSASGAVSGHIYLEGSLKPIANVIVSCAGIADTTQKSGHYVIMNIPSGSRAITAANPYYETYNSTVIVNADETTVLDIFLKYDESQN